MADKIVVMNSGKIEQIGTPDEVYEYPNSRYVADFIGSPSMNFIEGQIFGDRSEQFLIFPGFASSPFKCSKISDQRVCAGVRPNELDLALDENSSIQVTYSEKTGADVNVYMTLTVKKLCNFKQRFSYQVGSRVRLV